MASKTDQLLIVVSILGGRNFPKSPRHSLVVQAKFDGEQLSTDPVEHRELPQFCTELAWELDRRTLHQHRLQRTPIKLQCFAVDSISQMKENIGYIVLDLRSVQEVKQDPKWYPLLSSKYTKLKPAILLTMLLENDTKPVEPSPDRFKAKKAPPRQGSPALTELPEKLEAVLIQDQGYHQVGPPEYCTDMFVLSVTVAFATKLEQLIPSTMKLSGDSDFFFYYRLLDNDITSEPFRNLLNPSFEPERASVRIRSSKQIIHTFLGQQPCLQIHLCCGNHSLGSTEVSLSALTTSAVDLHSQPTTVEGAFVLKPPNRTRQKLPALPADLQPTVGVAVTLRTRQKLPALPADLQPTVGVAVTLRMEEFVANEEGAGEAQFPSRPSSHPPSVPPPNPAISLPPPEERARTPSLVKRTSSGQPLDSPCSPAPAASPPATHPPASHTESEVESLREELHAGQSQPGQAASEVEVGVQDHGQAEILAAEGGVSSVSVSAPKVSIPASAHHYCFSLDLRSLGRLSLTHPVNAMLRYSYQFFGSAAPIMTNPPVELQRNMEVFLPQSYCAFDFAALPQQLQDTFLRVPVLVEVWHRDSSSRDQLMGTASIQLSALLTADKTRFLGATGEQHWRQTHTDRIPILKPQSPSEKVAELFYVTTLEDLGLVTAKDISVSDSLQNVHPPGQQKQPQQPASKPAAAPSSAPQDPTPARETMEYRTALELELWKEEQEDLFDDQLKKKELSHMQALAEEWRKRDSEREALVRKKEVEYNLLEEQLQKTLCDLERREKQLANAEIETQRLQKDLRAEHELTQRELQESSRRLRLDADHRVVLERDKVRLMEEERARLLQQIADGESRYKQLEKDTLMLREQQNIRPELRLQSEINLLKLEKAELERKLEATTKSKLYYKQQWGRALKELARFKQREQENAMARLKKQQEEIEAMRLRYLATEEKETVRTERQELDDIRNELNRLKQQEVRFGPASSFSGPAPGRSQSPAINESADDHLSRLLEERDTLLRTGVYTHEDRIITELNRQIQQAMAERGTH